MFFVTSKTNGALTNMDPRPTSQQSDSYTTGYIFLI